MPQSLQDVLDLFDVQDLGGASYRGAQPVDDVPRVRVFGGQVVAQAMAAAARTVSGRLLHSLHASFLRPGNPAVPLRYAVTSLREGRTFSTRRVTTVQGDVVVMEAMTSFIEPIAGDDYQQPMPLVTPPEALPTLDEQLAPYIDEGYAELARLKLFEMRYIDPPPRVAVDAGVPEEAVCRVWFRVESAPPRALLTDPMLAQCLLGYVSDWTILDPVQVGVGKTWQSMETMASLDHAMWFHRPVDFSDWLLYDQRAPSAIGGRGLGSGLIYNRSGELVCTVTQEGFLGRRR
ncbi:acyl-CoA thioesterase [Mycolicibacterium murale]|uniref:acyl-CoA thioesterase n=1 Tax=Mycolicibacterium murale TaxID=182220 RepID=UPI001875729D|nr:acyl-CoA thioesterase domain-containing protein [Mycolicibacterium murale]MCV7181418.1 thioesterase family protein [Mycolicibacterium murale]